MPTGRPAVFLDRDGTIIHDERYLSDPEQVVAVAGAAAAITRLRAAGYAIVVVTNQSGLARGYFTPAQYETVRERTAAVFAAAGAVLDATYMCPHHPGFTGPCDCRKPGIGLYTRAARDLRLDLSRSVLIGDRWSDIAAAPELGARGILVRGPETPAAEADRAAREGVAAASLGAAADAIIAA
jgi:histidinol-phosphate phosphatase family protein